jgi:two-component system, OmpR family, sensor kinase
VRDISLNNLEKKSFYSFLSLYIGSSFLFVVLLGFWYYKAQENSLNNAVYYKMQHYADVIGGLIINAEMKQKVLVLPKLQEGYSYSLVSMQDAKPYTDSYVDKDGYKILISPSPQDHMNVRYVIIKTSEYNIKLLKLKKEIIFATLILFLFIAFISWMLAGFFMKPINQKVSQIEQFIQDISHELNTPITALQMSSKRILQKKVYDEKILTNISISTKQLYTIYQSLAYLNFSVESKELTMINIRGVIEDTIQFYAQLCQAKHITVIADLEDTHKMMDTDKARLLFSNLLSNAIKYSMPNTTITIELKQGVFTIEDQGIGIAKEQLQEIFKLYKRGSDLAGGFGVGLSIVKKICDEEGIKIEIDSTLEKGSRFTLLFS